MAGPVPDLALARRLERLVAEELLRFVETAHEWDPDHGAACLEVAGGAAVFIAGCPPLNQAVALGMDGPVMPSDLDAVEGFFRDRRARPAISVCPLAHPTLLEGVGERGWAVESFENVLVRTLDRPVEQRIMDGVVIVEAETDEERELWSLVAATGFSAPLDPSTEDLMLCGLVVRRPRTRLFLAFVDGRPAGTGELFVSGDAGWLSADATLPQFRGRGVQSALQAARLAAACSAGCDIAVSEAVPGGVSQRNMHRHGFTVAYTRANLAAPGKAGRE